MRIIAGQFKGRAIKTLKGLGYRPATGRVREAIFSILHSHGVSWPKVSVIDFFAGSGILGIEALSRGAMEVWFVDNQKKAVSTIKENLLSFNISKKKWKVICRDVFEFIKRETSRKFDIVFIDPPYRKGLLEKFLLKLLASNILSEDCLIMAEVEKELVLFKGELTPLLNRTYGQTRLYLWKVTTQK